MAGERKLELSFYLLFRVQIILGLVTVEALPVASLVIGLVLNDIGWILLGLFLQALVLPLFLNTLFLLREVAQAVVLTDEGIEARTFLGRETSLKWNEVAGVREFDVSFFGDRIPEMRLIGERGERVALDGRIPGYDEGAEEIRRQTEHARRFGDERRWWRRQLCGLR